MAGPVITLVLGGARSGKSEVAERLVTRAASNGGVAYVATAVPSQGDSDFKARISLHRSRRPTGWTTEEVALGGHLGKVLLRIEGAAIVDSLGTWVAGFEGREPDTGELIAALAGRRAERRPTVLVSDEVGLGVHPETEIGRVFRDALGALNRAVAEVADEVLLVVAGRVLKLERAE
ncbi:MAG TPA: bifunctional adenosylcobinamide kinase/adenosylcobinamide-phosphate guanylyltransferase [Acidimicrobiales bacterium]|nr:bifunctional adenosylcobinamide kinase/adenosylcobinamide-phosphate guanylyltransferase [Acidimicrobiales bacterium]